VGGARGEERAFRIVMRDKVITKLQQIEGDPKVLVHLIITVKKHEKNNLNSFNYLP
jgi:hypothetical protein